VKGDKEKGRNRMRNHPDIEIISEHVLTDAFLQVKRYRLRHRRFDGDMTPVVEREVCVRGLAVGVLLYDPARDVVALVEQFRAGAADGGGPAWMTEIVAGMVKAGETPEEVAYREAEEEAGATITALEKICTYFPSPGVLSENVHVFCGRVDSAKLAAFGGVPEEHEDIRIKILSVEEALALMDGDALNNSITIIALGWLARRHDALRKAWTASS
jgi:ADP-ribose pyrophosphatase